jgi:hypothetical protein
MRPVSFQGWADVGTGLGGVTGWHICDGSRQRRTASDQVNTVGHAGSAAPGTSQKKGTSTTARSVASHPARRHQEGSSQRKPAPPDSGPRGVGGLDGVARPVPAEAVGRRGERDLLRH